LVVGRNGTSYEYTGERTAVSIVTWINKKTGPPSRKVSCEALGSKIIDKLNVVYFGNFFGELFDLYIEVAKSNEVYSFYHASDKCASEWDAKPNTINIFRQFDT